jgi:hypothetical protein
LSREQQQQHRRRAAAKEAATTKTSAVEAAGSNTFITVQLWRAAHLPSDKVALLETERGHCCHLLSNVVLDKLHVAQKCLALVQAPSKAKAGVVKPNFAQ